MSFFILLTYLLLITQRMKQKYGFDEYGTEFWRIDDSKVV